MLRNFMPTARSWGLPAAVLYSFVLSCVDEPSAPDVVIAQSTAAATSDDGNSPFELELKAVSSVGFLDGTTCESWPKSVPLQTGGEPLDVLSDALPHVDQFFPEIGTVFDRMRQLGIDDVHAIGSKHRLVLQEQELVDGQSTVVAIDPQTKAAFAIDHRLLCTAEDAAAGQCVFNPINHPFFGPISVLRLNRPRNRPSPSLSPPARRLTSAVIVVAPRITVPFDITVDVDLIIAADAVDTGDTGNRVSIVARSVGYNLPYTPNVNSNVEEWRDAVDRYVPASFVVVACHSCSGLEALRAGYGPRVEEIRFTTARTIARVINQPFGVARLEVPATELLSTPSQPLSIPGGPFGTHPPPRSSEATEISEESCSGYPTTATEWTRPTLQLEVPSSLPGRRDSIRGGVAAAFCDDGCTNLDVNAPGSTSAWFSWDEFEIQDYIRNEFARHIPEYNCERVIETIHTIGLTTCHLECKDIKIELIRGDSVWNEYYDGPGTADRIANAYYGNVVIRELPRSSNTGDNGVAQVQGNGFWAGNYFTQGAVTEELVHQAQNQSLRQGFASERWAEIGELLATAPTEVLDPSNPDELLYRQWLSDGFGIESALMTTIDANQEAALAKETLEVYPNALGLAAGKTAASWLVEAPSGTTPLTSIIDLESRWSTLATLIDELNRSVEEANEAALMAGVIQANLDQLSIIDGWATAMASAAADARADKEELVSAITAAESELLDLQTNLEDAFRETWDCPTGDLLACESEIEKAIEDFIAECTATTFFDDLLETAGTVLPLVSAASVVASLATEALELVDELADAAKKTRKLLEKADKVISKVSKGLKGIETIRKLSKKKKKLLEDAVGSCTSGEQTQIQFMIQTISNTEAIAGLMEVQLNTTMVVLQSLLADVGYLAAVELSAQSVTSDVEQLEPALNNLLNAVNGSPPPEYFRLACRAARHSADTGLRDMHRASALLETSAGRTTVSPQINVPGLDGDPDVSSGFLYSLWDEGRFDSTFSASGQSIVTPTTKAIADRFGELVGGTLCRTTGDYAAPRYLVKKRITGEQLTAFVTTGRADFLITVDDLLGGGENAVNGVSAVEVENAVTSSISKPLASPVVLDVRYAACDASGCDVSAMPQLPYLVKSSFGQVATSTCSVDETPVTGTIPVAAWDGQLAQSCLKDVTTERVTASLSRVDGALSDDALMTSSLNGSVCLPTDPSVTALLPVRGVPALGSWTLTYDFPSARRIAKEFQTNTDPVEPPPTSYQDLETNGTITAIDVLIIVGAQHPGSTQPTAFEPVF